MATGAPTRVFILLCSFLTFSACSTAIQAYQGEALPDSEVALIRGYDTFCNGKVLISDLDGQYTGLWLKTPEGRHHMKVTVQSIPFSPDDPNLDPSYECSWISHFQVEFAVRAGHEYWFYANHIVDKDDSLTVYESSPDDSTKGQPVETIAVMTSIRKACFAGGEYTECLHH